MGQTKDDSFGRDLRPGENCSISEVVYSGQPRGLIDVSTINGQAFIPGRLTDPGEVTVTYKLSVAPAITAINEERAAQGLSPAMRTATEAIRGLSVALGGKPRPWIAGRPQIEPRDLFYPAALCGLILAIGWAWRMLGAM